MSEEKKTKLPNRTAEKFVVRLPIGMRERISNVAKQCHRSMNSEIVLRLEQSLNSADTIYNSTQLANDDTNKNNELETTETSTMSNSELENDVIRSFRKLTPRQQRALVVLLKQSPL